LKVNTQEDSYVTEPSRPIRHSEMADDIPPLLQKTELTSEFFDLIYESDPEASNDNYYVTSADFVQLHSQIRSDLRRSLFWWAIGLCGVLAGTSFVYM
jgi:hypothetical protein